MYQFPKTGRHQFSVFKRLNFWRFWALEVTELAASSISSWSFVRCLNNYALLLELSVRDIKFSRETCICKELLWMKRILLNAEYSSQNSVNHLLSHSYSSLIFFIIFMASVLRFFEGWCLWFLRRVFFWKLFLLGTCLFLGFQQRSWYSWAYEKKNPSRGVHVAPCLSALVLEI